MSNHYLFDNCKTENILEVDGLVEDGVDWEHVQGLESYTQDDANMIENNNETFLTANDGGHDETQFFSILDNSSNTSLNNVYSLDDETLQEEKTENEFTQETQYYAIEGSTNLMGVVILKDKEGNATQHYRYMMTMNDHIPDSLERIIMTDQAMGIDSVNKEFAGPPLVKQETFYERSLEEVVSNASDSNSECKLKVDEYHQVTETLYDEQLSETIDNSIKVTSDQLEDIYLSEGSNSNDYVNVNSLPQDAAYEFLHEESEDGANSETGECYNNFQESLSDVEEYQSCVGDHVTGDFQEKDEIADVPFVCNSNSSNQILKTQFPPDSVVNEKNEKNRYLVFVRCPQKENLSKVKVNKQVVKPNPRSLLKVSQNETVRKPNEIVTKNENMKYVTSLKKLPKMQSMVPKSSVVHPPVRLKRQPRKQTITTVKRDDEEIIVQEVLVSSNGYVQTLENGVVKSKVPLKPSAYVNLEDSDENESNKNKKKRGRKRKSQPIVIRDSDEENDIVKDVVEIDLSHDSDSEKKKRKRGRPRKKPLVELDKPNDLKPQNVVKPKVDNIEVLQDKCVEEPKPNWKCPKCPKSFPSAGSLKTHIQHHNLLQDAAKQYKYKCKICKDRFKNMILLENHEKKLHPEKLNKFLCQVCNRSFNLHEELSFHKRMHIKAKMVRTTVAATAKPKPSPKKLPNICSHCSKSFSTPFLLKAHMRTHKLYICVSCSGQFQSEYALNTHMLTNCVKPKQRISSINSLRLKCKLCLVSFKSHANRYNHMIAKHGLKTPDSKSILQASAKKRFRKEHTGIPANNKIKNICEDMYNTFLNDK